MSAPLNSDVPIGLFDSGLGGLTVLRELKRALPHESFVYLGDTARTPYGSKASETIIRYAKECAHFLLRQEIKLLVVACNTASSLALEILEQECPCPVIGTIEPAVQEASLRGQAKRVGVIGTAATIASQAYQERLKQVLPDAKIFSKACPLFVPLVEEGILNGEIVEKVTELYLKELKEAELDALILGCTHYPLLVDSISKYMGQHVHIIQCSHAVSSEAKRIIGERTTSNSKPNIFYTTDTISTFNRLAQLLLEGTEVKAVRVDELLP